MNDFDPNRNAASDRNLLFGILALQMDLISQDALIAAMNAWVLDKSKSLGEILVSQQALAAEHRTLLDALVAAHLARHGQDPAQSLVAVRAAGLARQKIEQLGDAQVRATLSHLLHGGPKQSAAETMAYQRERPAGSRFAVLRPFAKGGLGEVFVARDEELNREVALKEIQARYAHEPASRARFVQEAEVTGRLEHPGIVPVYGFGTHPDGRPYYAMRLVKGESFKDAIRRFHEANYPDPGQRSIALRKLLGAFLTVCQAVQYAHSRGILHRDLKPDNVLLGKYGETLLVDWGLAKPVGQPEQAAPAAEVSLLRPLSGSGALETQAGTALGTPGYMSPEQAAGRLDQVGTASDVYGLGATLYCLLTGRAPFSGGDVGEVLQRVVNGDFVAPRQVDAQVPAALEAVCLKAMAHDPAQRYASAQALAEEVERWLADEPVGAYREPWRLRLGRWGRRHRAIVSGAAALLVTAVIALAVSTVLVRQQQQATEAQKVQAEQNLALAQRAVEEYLVKVADHPRLSQANFHELRKELLETALPFYEEFARQAGGDAVQAERGRAYGRLGKVHYLLGATEKALADYEAMRAIFTELVAQQGEQPEYLRDLGRSHQGLARALRGLGRLPEAQKEHQQALVIQQKLVAGNPTAAEYRQDLARSHDGMAIVLGSLGQRTEAEKEYRLALDLWQKLVADFPKVAEYRWDLARSHGNFAGTLADDPDRLAEAEQELRRAIDLEQKLVTDFPKVPEYRWDLALDHNNLGAVHRRRGHPAEAEKELRLAMDLQQQLATEFPTVPDYRRNLARSHSNLAVALRQQDRLAEAEKEYRLAIELQQQLAAESPTVPDCRQDLAKSHYNLAILLELQGRRADTEKEYQRASGLLRKLAADFPSVVGYREDLGRSSLNLSVFQANSGELAAALESAREGQAIYERLAAEHPEVTEYRDQVVNAAASRAGILAQQGDYRQAAAALGPIDPSKAPSGITRYNVACAWSRAYEAVLRDPALPSAEKERLGAAYATHALEWLAKVQDKGLLGGEKGFLKQVKTDKDLDPLRGRPEFQKFVAELEQEAAQGK